MVGLPRLLVAKPKVAFLDEATSALDNETENEIVEEIKHFKGKNGDHL